MAGLKAGATAVIANRPEGLHHHCKSRRQAPSSSALAGLGYCVGCWAPIEWRGGAGLQAGPSAGLKPCATAVVRASRQALWLPSSEELAEARVSCAAHRQPCAVLQDRHPARLRIALDARKLIHIEQVGPMNADEP